VWIAERPAADLSVDVLARRSAMSVRNFSRAFRRDVGVTPARFVERIRVEAARRHLEDSAVGLEDVAARAGFRTAEVMRRAFHRIVHVRPAAYRRGRGGV
jgi:transcriptional regulator GlxA family with amidase domain